MARHRLHRLVDFLFVVGSFFAVAAAEGGRVVAPEELEPPELAFIAFFVAFTAARVAGTEAPFLAASGGSVDVGAQWCFPFGRHLPQRERWHDPHSPAETAFPQQSHILRRFCCFPPLVFAEDAARTSPPHRRGGVTRARRLAAAPTTLGPSWTQACSWTVCCSRGG